MSLGHGDVTGLTNASGTLKKSYKHDAASFASGAVATGLAVATCGASLVASGAISSTADYLMYSGLAGEDISLSGLAFAAGTGAATGRLGTKVNAGAKAVGNAVKNTGKIAPQKSIGHFPEYLELAETLGTKPFSVPENIWNKMTPGEQWTANQKFLDRAISKGAEFNLATPIDKVRPGSFLEKEIKYLTSQGYKFNSDKTKLVK